MVEPSLPPSRPPLLPSFLLKILTLVPTPKSSALGDHQGNTNEQYLASPLGILMEQGNDICTQAVKYKLHLFYIPKSELKE